MGAPNNGVKEERQFSFIVAVAFTVNYIVGTGFLTIPWAFSQAGCFLSILILSGVVYFAIASALFILEAMARADTVLTMQLNLQLEEQRSSSISELAPLQTHDSTLQPVENTVGEREIELTELCLIFMGRYGKGAYTISLTIYLYCTLLAYSTVFSNAFATHMNIGPASYNIYLSIFAAIAIPLSCAELSEQIYLQVTLALGRCFLFLTMISTIIIAVICNNNPFNGYSHVTPGDFTDFHLSNIHLSLPILVFAIIFHHSLPALSHPVADKTQLASIFTTTIFGAFTAYLILGVVVSLFFGKDTPTSANLLWSNYSGFQPLSQPGIFGRLVSTFVVLFPAMGMEPLFNSYD